MSPAVQFFFYAAAMACFLAAAFGLPRNVRRRRPVALGWLGAAFLATIGLVAAWQAAW